MSTSTAAVPPATLTQVVLPTLAVSVVAVVVAGVAAGSPGALGAAVGAVLVLGFFSLTHQVLGRTRDLPPEMALIIALGLYTAKVVALAMCFVALSASGLLGDQLHRASLAVTVIVCTVAWTVAEVRAAMGARIPTYVLNEESR
jgi:ATP synthase protein I